MNEPTALPHTEALEVNAVLDQERPMVEILWDGHELRLDVRTAEQFAMSILRAARASEMDRFLLGWMLDSGYFNEHDATFLLEHFHDWRLARMAERRPRTNGEGH